MTNLFSTEIYSQCNSILFGIKVNHQVTIAFDNVVATVMFCYKLADNENQWSKTWHGFKCCSCLPTWTNHFILLKDRRKQYIHEKTYSLTYVIWNQTIDAIVHVSIKRYKLPTVARKDEWPTKISSSMLLFSFLVLLLY